MGVVTNPDFIWTMAGELLDAAVTSLTDNGLHVPSHQIVSWHNPSWDCCDHIGVHFGVIKPSRAGTSGEQRHAAHEAGNIFDADFTLTYIGCAATGDPIPSDEQISENAHEMYRNAWVLYQDLTCQFFHGELLPELDGCKLIRIGPLQPHPPMGGCEAFTILFTVELL